MVVGLMRRRRRHIKQETIFIILVIIIILPLIIIAFGIDKSFKEWLNSRDSYVEIEDVDDSLSVDGINSQYSPEKEAQIRRLNDFMSSFLDANDVE